MVEHPFDPVFDEKSRILILGSFPSVKSRNDGFYYANQANRFWPLMEKFFSVKLEGKEEKILFLKREHIALFDVIKSCTIKGSSDASIKDAKANDIAQIVRNCKIKAVFLNGSKAGILYQRFSLVPNLPYFVLPSTSPLNARMSLSALSEKWKMILDYL